MAFANILCGWLLLLPLATAHRRPTNVGATVNTTSGPVTGHPARNRTQVSEYLGIPYAQPPLGPLRFAAPQKFASAQPFNASVFSPYVRSLPNGKRPTNAFLGQPGNPQSEDCLTLNVWTKATSHQRRKPVLFWIHGGRFSIPGTHNPFYQGQYLADEEDVVVVTINQRVNIFGYSGAPGEPQNVGLLDQRLAVEWVRDNIIGFGGDPKRITIFGQSAGGASVDYYSYAWTKDPIVAGLISHSGTALSFNPNMPNMSATYWYKVSSLLGCGTSGNVLGCMRSKNTTDILHAIALVPPAPSQALSQPVFHPTVDNKTVFGDYAALSSNGSFAKLPYLAGNLDYEAGFYKLSAYAANKTLTPAQWDSFNLAGFTCPTGVEAANRVKYGVPTWRYRYFGDWPNLRLYPGSGAYHGSELEMVFGTAVDVSGAPNTGAENATSRYMMKAWAAFARSPADGLEDFGWPRYDPQSQTLVRLAFNNEISASFVDPIVYDAPCPSVNNPAPAQGAF
ncbi:hypothetical protein B0A49_01620 [Cryomyces minteri]|uniref:Carboxylic ester hydrolase n=2 Tax=Cryomyces minteri TaxID=331657 RepID=A0A4U0XVI3_9PEZI|nr:hypothetical protein B0A49_01620 [Cryomyces minteri]